MIDQLTIAMSQQEMDLLRAGIKKEYPNSPDLNGPIGGPVDVGHGYSISWVYDGSTLVLSLDGGRLFMGMAKSKVTGLISKLIGRNI